MERGEGEGPCAPHRAAGDEHAPDPMALFGGSDDLDEIGFCLWAHPRCRGPVVGGEKDRAVPGRRLARAAAFVTGLADELPAVGPMAMEGDEEIVGGGRVEVGGKEFDDALGRAVAVGGESEVDRLGGTGQSEAADHEQQKRCRERLS